MSEALSRLEERVRVLEQLLFGLKIAAGVLGVTTLGVAAYVASATSGANKIDDAKEEAIRAIQQNADEQLVRFRGSLRVRKFPPLTGSTIQNQNLGSFPACFLIDARTIHDEQPCGCSLTENSGAWSLEMKLDQGLRGKNCVCRAACLEVDA